MSDSAVFPLPLVTERLRLRLHVPEDKAWLHRVYSRQDVARYLLFEPWTEADAAAHLATRLTRTGLDSDSGALALVIEHEAVPVGDTMLWFTDREYRVAEVGWMLDPEHGGRGFATEAVRAVLDRAFECYQLHRVVARMDARNHASAKLAANVGMHREAHLRQDWWSKGEWTDTLVFGMLASDR